MKAYGYCVIRLPKADVKPLQILAKQGDDLDRLGNLSTLLVAGSAIPLPPMSENTPAANISGQRTGDLSLGVGLSILGSVIGAMGGSKLGLDVKYHAAKTVAFEFSDVLEDKVEVARLDQYLADADVNPFPRYVAELLEADEVYVTTATIKSQKFTVEAKKSDGTTVDLSIPEIQGPVGGNVKVSGQAQTTSKLTYEGTMPLVFGFQDEHVLIPADFTDQLTTRSLGLRSILEYFEATQCSKQLIVADATARQLIQVPRLRSERGAVDGSNPILARFPPDAFDPEEHNVLVDPDGSWGSGIASALDVVDAGGKGQHL